MKFQRSLMVVMITTTLMAGTGYLGADEGEKPGFWGRFNPFRAFLGRSSARVEADAPGKIDKNSDPFFNELNKAGLTEEGLSVAEMEARLGKIEQVQARQKTGKQPIRPAFANGEAGRPTLEELRVHLLERGVDPSRIDARIEKIQAHLETRKNRREERRRGKAGLKGKGFPFGNKDDFANDLDGDVELDELSELRPEPKLSEGDIGISSIPRITKPDIDIDVYAIKDDEERATRRENRGRRGGFGRARNRD